MTSGPIRPKTNAWVHRRHGHYVYATATSHRTGTFPPSPDLWMIVSQLPDAVGRVWLVGDEPFPDRQSLLAWAFDLPLCCRFEDDGSYLDTEFPVIRLLDKETGRRVEVRRMAHWYGDRDTTVHEASAAWDALQTAVRDHFGREVALLSSPGSTGLMLWDRVRAGDYEHLEPDGEALLRERLGQGRVELFLREGTLPGLYVYDRRFAYAAHTARLGVAPIHHQSYEGEARRFTLAGIWAGQQYVPAFYHAIWKIPHTWHHLGILPCWSETFQRWVYPRSPRFPPNPDYSGWVTEAELRVAIRWGWEVEVDEGLLLQPTERSYGQPSRVRPLDNWSNHLREIWLGFAEAARDNRVARLCQEGARSILLHGIGAFASRGQEVTSVLLPGEEATFPQDDALAVATLSPADPETGVRTFRRWQEQSEEWKAKFHHPEWPLQVWGRARAGLLTSRERQEIPAGALWVRYEDLIALRTDAIVTSADPGFLDDGHIGSFRKKGERHEPLPAPQTWEELNEWTRSL